MSRHALAPSTRTVEMIQVMELNDRLHVVEGRPVERRPITAGRLGLAGALIEPHLVDRAAALLVPQQDRHSGPQPLMLSASAVLHLVVAAGAPSFPYLYGLFSDGGEHWQLPTTLHTEQLQAISLTLDLRGHRWGV